MEFEVLMEIASLAGRHSTLLMQTCCPEPFIKGLDQSCSKRLDGTALCVCFQGATVMRLQTLRQMQVLLPVLLEST